MLNDPHANKLTILSLERSSVGWHVVIPAAAIEKPRAPVASASMN